MIRTLTIVFVFALLGGAAVGFFAKETISRRAVDPFSPVAHPKIERRIEFYRELYHLDDAALEDIRGAHEEYYRAIDDLVDARVQRLLQEIYAPDSKDRERLDALSQRFHERVNRRLPEWARGSAPRESRPR